MEPRLIPMEPGGWLAVSGADSAVPVGVFGRTQDDARRALDAALQARAALHAESATARSVADTSTDARPPGP